MCNKQLNIALFWYESIMCMDDPYIVWAEVESEWDNPNCECNCKSSNIDDVDFS